MIFWTNQQINVRWVVSVSYTKKQLKWNLYAYVRTYLFFQAELIFNTIDISSTLVPVYIIRPHRGDNRENKQYGSNLYLRT